MNTISAVLPCYNQGEYISEAIESLLIQTHPVTEIIVVNDGSTDKKTLSLLESASWPKTRIIHQDNAGVSAARNTGISASTGDYIVNLDSDDLFAPDFLKKAAYLLDTNTSIGAVGSWVAAFGNTSAVWKPKGGSSIDFLSANQCTANNLFRREFWAQAGGFDDTMVKGFEDWEFWLNGSRFGWTVSIIPEILTYYRKKNEISGLTKAYQNKPEIVAYITRKHLPLYQEHVERIMREKEELIQRIYNSPIYLAGLDHLNIDHPLS